MTRHRGGSVRAACAQRDGSVPSPYARPVPTRPIPVPSSLTHVVELRRASARPVCVTGERRTA